MEEKNPPTLYHHPDTHTRWTWVRRFIVSLFILALVLHCAAPKARLSQLWEASSNKHCCNHDAKDARQQQEPKIVLHTGFPVPDALTGQTILPNHAAAVAFSPMTDDDERSSGRSTVTYVGQHRTKAGESWWDRLFPWRHVHLHSVQLAVTTHGQLDHVRATLSICTSARDSLWQNIPDMQKCVASATSSVVVVDPPSDEAAPQLLPLGIMEWIPEEAIVLKKKQIYWLVVQAAPGTDEFDWVFAQVSGGAVGDRGLAYQSDAGWQLQDENDDGQPIPSVIITVTDHK
ncbi:hypothetical protein BX666DRAFT_2022408 [Dichotomocladium elegans]|nr:hypothetical protein BX666DRAFT_2022408 [Dichotomocladium elegans]